MLITIVFFFSLSVSRSLSTRAFPCRVVSFHAYSGRLQAGLGNAERSVSREVESHTHPPPQPRSCLGAVHRHASAVAQDESQASNTMEYSDPSRTANDHTSRGAQDSF